MNSSFIYYDVSVTDNCIVSTSWVCKGITATTVNDKENK